MVQNTNEMLIKSKMLVLIIKVANRILYRFLKLIKFYYFETNFAHLGDNSKHAT